MKPKEIVRLREAAKDMTHDALVTTICTLVDDYKRQSELLEEARKLADMAIDCVTTDVTMQGPRVTGVNGSAARRASEMARSFLSNLEEPQP